MQNRVRNPKKQFDGEGLYLEVRPNSKKHWRLKYRFGGKEKLLAIGPYPVFSLAEARDSKRNARAVIAKGIDPAVQHRLFRLTCRGTVQRTVKSGLKFAPN